MEKRQENASSKSRTLISPILTKLGNLTKSRRDFILSVMLLYLSLRGRYTFLGMSRYGSYCEKSYRLHFEEPFDFLAFNKSLVLEQVSGERILAFDPSYLPKSGCKTPLVGKFWSGVLGKAVQGLELGALAVVDIKEHTAFHLEAIQTPNQAVLKAKGQSLVEHYSETILARSSQLLEVADYLVVDAYFSKENFVTPIIESGLKLISKLRKDANLNYLYDGKQKKGRGRPRKFSGKVELNKLDKRIFKATYQDKDCIIYEAIVWSVSLKRNIKLAYVDSFSKKKGAFSLLFSSDTKLSGEKIYHYYKARFQIEFLFRDAKQHMGLTHSQARSENKLHFHFNLSLTMIGIAKIPQLAQQKNEPKKAFSIANIKTKHSNERFLDLFLSKYQIDPNSHKNKMIYHELSKFGEIAA